MRDQRSEILRSKLVNERKKYKTDSEFGGALGGIKGGTVNKWLVSDPPVWPSQPYLEKIADYFKTDIESLTNPASPKLRCREAVGSYSTGDVRQIIESLPLPEQVGCAIEILARAKDAIAV